MPKQLYVISEFIVNQHISYNVKDTVRELCKINPLDMIVDPNITVHDLVMAHGLENFDYTLPQNWIDSVREKTGINPVGKVVWNYEENKCGQPFGLTREGVQLIAIYNYIMDHETVALKEYKDAMYKIRGVVNDCL